MVPKKVLLAFVVLVAVVALVGSVPAGATGCENFCMDRFDQEVEACDDQLAADTAVNEAAEQECREGENGDPPGLKGCLNAVAQQQKQAVKDHQQCLNAANVRFNRCSKQCDFSPA
ncbi:MAG: hypothetical protein OEQ13_01880 [Acidobacteriota bacterium]|nr:hypothetical protein [Acidobacteriota bacterium]